MNTRRCLRIARAIDQLLTRELGGGIDAARMVAEPLYARDVLLVCDALRDTELPALALRFRRAAMADADRPAGARPSGFSASRFLSSLFGGLAGSDKPLPPPAEPRPRATLK